MDKILQYSIELYKSGLPGMKVCEISGIGSCRLYKNLKTLGLTRSNKINSRKHNVNHHFFGEINAERKAYWLGFMYADGFITGKNNVGISLGAKDKKHLERFKKALGAAYEIKDYKALSYGKLIKYSRLLMTSTQMHEDLINKGVVKRKSLVLMFPKEDILPKDLIHHFMRGYFDGVGSFSKSHDGYQVKVCGTKEFLTDYAAQLGYLNVNLYKRKKDMKNNYYISIGGRLQVIEIGDFLYKNANVKLGRKYNRYRRLLRMHLNFFRKNG